jgi:hypothetical protein
MGAVHANGDDIAEVFRGTPCRRARPTMSYRTTFYRVIHRERDTPGRLGDVVGDPMSELPVQRASTPSD